MKVLTQIKLEKQDFSELGMYAFGYYTALYHSTRDKEIRFRETLKHMHSLGWKGNDLLHIARNLVSSNGAKFSDLIGRRK